MVVAEKAMELTKSGIPFSKEFQHRICWELLGYILYNQHWKIGWWIYPRYGWEITSQQLHNQNLYKSYIADMIDGIAIQPDISRLDFTWIVVGRSTLW
jgi:hypothetical protein